MTRMKSVIALILTSMLSVSLPHVAQAQDYSQYVHRHSNYLNDRPQDRARINHHFGRYGYTQAYTVYNGSAAHTSVQNFPSRYVTVTTSPGPVSGVAKLGLLGIIGTFSMFKDWRGGEYGSRQVIELQWNF